MKSMHESWFNASPTVPFSFTGGEFSRTSKEVKDCITRDCESTTLHNTTAHFAPSARQNQFITERAKKEEAIATSPRRQYVPSGVGASIGGSTAGSISVLPKLKLYGTEVDLSLTIDSIRRSPRHTQELEWLRSSGRKEYLRQRRLEPYTADIDAAVYTPTSRRIGEQYFAGPSPFTPRSQPDFRRKTCHETMCTGVFPREE